MCQNGVRAKETEADIAEHVFLKDNMNLKHWMYFLNQTFEADVLQIFLLDLFLILSFLPKK